MIHQVRVRKDRKVMRPVAKKPSGLKDGLIVKKLRGDDKLNL